MHVKNTIFQCLVQMFAHITFVSVFFIYLYFFTNVRPTQNKHFKQRKQKAKGHKNGFA